MQVTDLLRILRTRWRVIAAVVCVAMLAVGALLPSKIAQPGTQMKARATSTLVLERPDGGGGKQPSAKDFSTLGIIASEGNVPAQVAAKLGTTVPVLVARVKITSTPATQSISIVAVDRTKDAAAKTANTYSDTLVAVLTSKVRTAQSEDRAALTQQVRQLESTKTQLDEKVKADPAVKPELDGAVKQLNNQRAKLNDLNAEPPADPGLRSVGPATVQALPPAKGANRFLRLPIRLSLAGLVSLVGSLGAFVLLDRFDVRLRTKPAVELAYGLPVLAEVPTRRRTRSGSLPVVSQPNTAYVEAHRVLRTAILSSAPAKVGLPDADPAGPCIIVVASAEPAEGKTATAANLAASFAEAGRDTLLVGLDLRHNDLSTVVASAVHAEEIRLPSPRGDDLVTVSIRDTELQRLRLATLAPPIVPPAIALPTVAAWLRGLQAQVDVIVVDTPPLLVCNDASEIIPFADTVLLACRAGRTTVEATERVKEVLSRLDAPVCGVVLVGATLRPSARKVAAYGLASRADHGPPPGDGPGEPPRPLAPTWPPAPAHPLPVPDDEGSAAEPPDKAHRPAAREEQSASDPAGPQHRAQPPEPAATPSQPPPEAAWRPVAVAASASPASVRRSVSRAFERLNGWRKLRS